MNNNIIVMYKVDGRLVVKGYNRLEFDESGTLYGYYTEYNVFLNDNYGKAKVVESSDKIPCASVDDVISAVRYSKGSVIDLTAV